MEGMIGEVRIFAGNFAPRTWAFCEGQLLAISSNTALFSILGTTYGGDGRTTFGLPDLRGRTAIGPGNGPGLSSRRLGAKGGTETNTLNTTQLPSHNHTATLANVTGTAAATLQAGGGKAGGTANGGFISANNEFKASGNGENIGGLMVNVGGLSGSVTVGNTGGNQSVNNMQPWLAIYYVICLQGVFPSRS